MTLEELRAEIIQLSGSGKRVAPNSRRHGIYTTFTVPGLDDMVAVRDTKQRFADFGIPDNLHGKLAIDIGCNVGACSLELARRGARVVGVEYREDRVVLCRQLFEYFDGFEGEFCTADFNDKTRPWEQWTSQKYDLVWSTSVDEYIEDVPAFYRLLLGLCPEGLLYLESNIQDGVSEVLTMTRLKEAGAKTVDYLGNGHSGGISRKRKLFRASNQ